VSGIVIIEAVLSLDGRVQNARVLRSVPMLDQAALEAVKVGVHAHAAAGSACAGDHDDHRELRAGRPLESYDDRR
jgi:hypothetical protein